MASALLLKFPSKDNTWAIEQLSLTRDSHDSRDTMVVDVADKIWSGSHSTVYRGTVQGGNDVVALKFARTSRQMADLSLEAAAYKKELKPIQGSAVPVCYGLFERSEEIPPRVKGCLVLQYCGERVEKFFESLPIDMRIQILQQLAAVHKVGLFPLDFAERNVLVQGDQIRLIGFHDTQHHECRGMEFVPGIMEPIYDPLWCFDLYTKAEDMNVWKGAGVMFAGTGHYSEPYPMQEVINRLIPRWIIHDDKRSKEAIAEYLSTVKEFLDEGGTEEEAKTWPVYIQRRIYPPSEYPSQEIIDELTPKGLDPRYYERSIRLADYLQDIKKRLDQGVTLDMIRAEHEVALKERKITPSGYFSAL